MIDKRTWIEDSKNFGSTLKKIRKDKGFTQEKMCSEIITLSYYSRIERGISEPSITVFFKLLDVLNMTFDEFLFIHNDNRDTTDKTTWDLLTDLYHSGNIEELKKQKLLLDNQDDELLLTIINIFILRLKHLDIDSFYTELVLNQLINIEDWSSSEVKIFITIMDILPMETVFILVNQILKKRNIYVASKGYNSPYNKMLINSILLCINNSYISQAEKYLVEYKNILTIRNFFGHSMFLYLEGLILYLKGKDEEGKKKINDFFKVCNLIGRDDFSKKYKLFSEDIFSKFPIKN